MTAIGRTCERHGGHAAGACDRIADAPGGHWHNHHLGILPQHPGDFTPVSAEHLYGDWHPADGWLAELLERLFDAEPDVPGADREAGQ